MGDKKSAIPAMRAGKTRRNPLRVNTLVLAAHTPQLFQAAVLEAATRLRAGDVVALPTETVYGLAGNALDQRAVERIFEVKGRPLHNPIIVHVASLPMAKRCAATWPRLAGRLAKAFWPGPLTLVLPRAYEIPSAVTAGGSTVGVRWPRHPLIEAVIRECGFPLAAPSANLSNRISPTCAQHVLKQLADKIPLIVDGGPCQVGIESTVLDLTVSPPRILRPGMIHQEALQAVIGRVAASPGSPDGPLKSPGMLRKHYAPKAKLVIWAWLNEADLRARCAKCRCPIGRVQVIAHTRTPSAQIWSGVSVLPRDASAFARAIYAELHRADESGAKLIVVEALPKTSEWRPIADRLKRAAAV